MARSDRNHAHDVKRDFVPEGEDVEAPVEREDYRDFIPAEEPVEEPKAEEKPKPKAKPKSK